MATNRSTVFVNGQIYHVFNRGIDRRTVFTNKREYERMLETIWLYRFVHPGINFSTYATLPLPARVKKRASLEKKKQLISLLAYCLMPNHFHFVIRQEEDNGLSKFIANITNSYTKYFNIKRTRLGPLFQGTFKAVRVETDEQFLHLTRYVHLNPFSSFVVRMEELETYPWSSLSEYLNVNKITLCNKTVLVGLLSLKNYKEFVYNQADYMKHSAKIEHLVIDKEDN